MLGSYQASAIKRTLLKVDNNDVSIVMGGTHGSSANISVGGGQYRVTSTEPAHIGSGNDTRPDNTAFAPRIVAF